MDEGWSFLFALAPLLVLVAAVDLRTGRIPDAANAAIAALGLVRVFRQDSSLVPERLLDALILGLLLLLLRRLYFTFRGRTGLGLGDVKFLTAATLWTGLAAIPLVVFFASVAALVGLAARALAGQRLTAETRLRFGPYLAAALFLTLVADRFLVIA